MTSQGRHLFINPLSSKPNYGPLLLRLLLHTYTPQLASTSPHPECLRRQRRSSTWLAPSLYYSFQIYDSSPVPIKVAVPSTGLPHARHHPHHASRSSRVNTRSPLSQALNRIAKPDICAWWTTDIISARHEGVSPSYKLAR